MHGLVDVEHLMRHTYKRVVNVNLVKMVKHFKKYTGWYILIPSIYLGLAHDGFMFVLAFLALMKMPPFNWVDRMFDWSTRLSGKLRSRVDAFRDTQHPVVSKAVYILMLIISLTALYIGLFVIPECSLC